MKKPVKIFIYSVGLTALTSSLVLSCGVYFPWQLLSNRQDTLLQMPAVDHFTQVVVSSVSLDPKEKKNLLFQRQDDYEKNPNRTCPNVNTDYQHAAELFHQKKWDEAYLAFSALSYNSPPAQQVCARYTLGRIERQMGKNEDAVETFNSTAYLVAHGAPDPLHLGISAYGEAAGVILDQLGTRTINKDGMVLWKVGEIKPDSAMQLERAVRLYATQVVLGDDDGASSIVAILKGLTDLDNPNAKILLDQTITSDSIRQPLMAYLLNNLNEDDGVYAPIFNDKVQKNILDAFVKIGDGDKNLGNDVWKIAVLAYKNKRIDLAKRWADYDWQKYKKSADAWVLAKIALMKGHREEAQHYYHEAIAHIQDGTLISSAQERVRGEQAVLTLSQGSFVQTMEQLWPVRDRYFSDIVYLAENVITTDELIQFTNRRTFPPKPGQTLEMTWLTDDSSSNTNQNTDQTIKMNWIYDYTLTNTPFLLRNILAHRLVREGRLQEARSYFVNPDDRKILDQYRQAIYDSSHSFWATDRAKATWNAANLSEDYGMMLSGTYGYPDQYPGYYPEGIGQFEGPKNNPNNRKWSVPAEQIRTGSSWPIPNRRFHYRYVAAQYALDAALLVPKQSQAYAALLCHANGWMQVTANKNYLRSEDNDGNIKLDTDINDSQFALAKSKEIYNQYLKNGAVVSFASHFGLNCPQPEFNRVPALKRKLFWDQIRSSLRFLKRF